MIRNIFIVCSSLLMLLSTISGCGGGTRGTGGVQLNGLVVSQNSQPLQNVTIDIPQNGDSVISDSDGRFVLETSLEPGELILMVTTSGFSSDVSVGQITSSTSSVTVTLKIDEENEEVDTDSVDIKDDDTNGEDGDSNDGHANRTPTPKNTRNPEHPSNPETPAPTATPTNLASPTVSPTSTPEDGDGESHHDGEDAEEEGRIQSITSSSILVRGESFVINGSTRFVDHDNHTISSTQFTVGKSVHVYGKWQSNIAVANKIQLSD